MNPDNLASLIAAAKVLMLTPVLPVPLESYRFGITQAMAR
jgi:hypothetical protein